MIPIYHFTHSSYHLKQCSYHFTHSFFSSPATTIGVCTLILLNVLSSSGLWRHRGDPELSQIWFDTSPLAKGQATAAIHAGMLPSDDHFVLYMRNISKGFDKSYSRDLHFSFFSLESLSSMRRLSSSQFSFSFSLCGQSTEGDGRNISIC